MGDSLQKPTLDLVEEIGKRFDNNVLVKLADEALAKLFMAFPENTDLSQILLKVVSLNSIYATNISLYTANFTRIEKMAQHIYENNIDALLASDDLRTVDLIADAGLGGKNSKYYSFASKYCSWQKPTSFPIYDSRARELLCKYKKQDSFYPFNRNDVYCINGYRKYYDIVAAFRENYGLGSLDFKKIDKFLYWYKPEGSKF
jgi:hypothetical protein